MPTPITFGALSARAFGFLGKLRAITDAYFKYVTLLLHGDGTNGAQNNTFLDGSTNNFTITRNGNTTQGTFSPFSQTGWSNYFDGSGDYLTGPNDAAFGFGTGDFTLECWVYCATSSITCWLFDFRTATNQAVPCLYGYGTSFYYYVSGADRISVTGLPSIENRWCHVAVARSGTSTKLFLNGEQIGSTWTDNTNYSQAAFKFGRNENGTLHISASYVSNIRVVKGTAVYTSNFTPPTAPLTAITNTSLLTCQSNRFIDNSSNAFTITRNGDVRVEAFSPFNPSTTYSTANVGGSGYFDGTGDYLSLADNAALNMGSSDFTIESWVYTNSGTVGAIVDKDGTSAVSWSQYLLYITSGGKFEAIISTTTTSAPPGSPSARLTGTTTVQVGTWYHVAVTRVGTNATLWVNGVSEATSSTVPATLNTRNQPATIGTNNNAGTGAGFFNGYLSNTRIVKGTAVYTANFTPPTAPLTAITNTQLLLNFTNAGIFDSASQTVLETVGNAQVSTTQKKFGTGSMYFDGTGDWLIAPDRPAQRFGTADFTVEGWLYLGATGAARGIISKGTASTGWSVNVTSGNKLQFSYTASNLTGTSSLSASTWYYFTAMRTGGSIRVYLNGTQEVTNSTAITDNFNQTNILYVGADRVGGSALNGYLDDIRITNGYARYNNFTVPSAALTPTAYTAALPNTSTTNGAQNNTFLDGSTNNFTITRNGNTTQGTFSPFSNSGWSNFFDGTGDYLSTPNASALQLTNSTAFTIELWFYANSLATTQYLFSGYNMGSPFAGWGLALGANPLVYTDVQFWDGGTWRTIGTVTIGQWNHVAVTYEGSGTTGRMFLNGTQSGSAFTVSSGINNTTTQITVGASTIGTGGFPGYISNVRLVKGTAVYTANFTPPTAPLTAITNTSLLTCQSNRLIDNSTNAFAITRNGDVSIQAFSPFTPAAYSSSTNGGSGYFDGAGDFLNLGGQSAFAFGTNDFTVEMWIYPLATGAQALYGSTPATTDGAYLTFALNASNNLTVYVSAATRITGSVVATVGQWTHVAVCRSGTSTRLFVNGNQDGITWTDTTSYLNGANRPVIGTNSYTTTIQNFNGYISNARVVNGTAVYTANFTPPTAPLTAITNTSLLLNFTNAGIFDAVGINNYETVGNAQASTTQAKFGTTSMYFDGTGDWLTAPDRPVNQLRAGDFTVEGWFYLSAINVAYGIVSKGTSTTGWSVNITSGNKLQFSYTSSNLTGATTLAASTWYHFAVVRSGGTVQIYLNGVQDAISSSAITTDFNQTNILYIGADRVGGSAMNGYLDDIRITPGQALYPGNFTPPTAPFPNN